MSDQDQYFKAAQAFAQAHAELIKEDFDAEVVKAKEVIKAKRKSLWSRFVRNIKTKRITIKLEDK